MSNKIKKLNYVSLFDFKYVLWIYSIKIVQLIITRKIIGASKFKHRIFHFSMLSYWPK
jgi:hypothetical protein